MDGPLTAIWGPNLWLLLHSAAERIGTRQPAIKTTLAHHAMAAEEARLWSSLLSSLRFSLPCPLCKKHYSTYYVRHTPLSGSPPPPERLEHIRVWLWGLHVDVNRRLGRSDGIGLDLLPTVYGVPFQLSKHWGIVLEHMMRAVRVGWCMREDVQRTARIMEELRRWYDFF